MQNGIAFHKVTGLLMKAYHHIIKWKWLNSNFLLVEKCRNLLVYLVCNSRELHASFGNLNPDKVFYVIRDPHRMAGLFAVHALVVGHIRTAIERGMIPIVDMQPFPYTLEEVYHSRNVVLCHGMYDGQLSEILDADKILQSHSLVSKYIKLCPEAEKICEEEWSRIRGSSRRILGVKCRGTDYVGLKLFGHAIMPSIQMTIEKIEEMKRIWEEEIGEYNAIFVATEDENILQGLKEHFKEELVFNDYSRFKNTGSTGLFDVINKGHGAQYKYEKMMDYLATTYCLSKCDALIAPMVNGTLGALRMKGGYEKVYIFQLGNYQ